jgi:starch synthase (maltosyl-transferring)
MLLCVFVVGDRRQLHKNALAPFIQVAILAGSFNKWNRGACDTLFTMPMAVKAGRVRVAIQNVAPEVDCGRFPIKRTIGEKVVVEADVLGDGHDEVRCRLLYGKDGTETWDGQAAMQALGNDRWRGEFTVTELGVYRYTLQGWIDHFQTWRRDLLKRLQADQDVTVELLIGGKLLAEAGERAKAGHPQGGEKGADARQLNDWAQMLLGNGGTETKIRVALDDALSRLMDEYPDVLPPPRHDNRELRVIVDPERARFGAWYELFPRSWSSEPGKHGTFRDLEAVLPYVAGMGFDVLYLPPIHPIGQTFKKGQNNTTTPSPTDPGSPWAIGSAEGGHKAVNPQLGDLADFRRLLAKAREHKLEVALDIAFQCAPDHPYVKSNPEWFKHRPDGSIQYAENPPKKYHDIYPLDFETERWSELWDELKSVFLFWIEQGVRIFRVDNPHTKPFAFWEWLITEIKQSYPEVIFLSEAFTRPKVMCRLAKLGFTQSYTYFAWRNTKQELTEYFTDLTQTEVREYFRPNLWPNTPDILTEYVQHGGRPAFMIRYVLAATLGASYGIYGPAFELCVNQPIRPGSEEYLNSEKYEIKDWDLDRQDSLRYLIARVNEVRRRHPALQSNRNLRFHNVDNPDLICFSKSTDDFSNVMLAVVNLDPQHKQAGWVDFPAHEFHLDPSQGLEIHDALADARYTWYGTHNYVELHPDVMPGHLFIVRGPA